MLAINKTFSRSCSRLAVRAIGLILLVSSFARGNLVANSDFLSYTGSPPKDFISNVLPTDWSSGGYVFVDTPGSADNPSDPGIPVYPPFPVNTPLGGNFIEADGTPGLSSPLTQTINTLIAGDTYTLSFYQAAGQELGDSFAGPTTEQWQVTLGSSPAQSSTLMSDPAGGVIPWQSQTMTFTATSSSELLSFVPTGTGLPPMVFLGNPDLEANVPEPSAFLLAGVGTVVGIGRLGRRLRAKLPTA